MTNENYEYGDPYAHARRGEFASSGRYTRDELDREREHLKLLSVFYYVIAGLNLFNLLFALVFFGLAILLFIVGDPKGRNAPPPEAGFFFLCAGFFVLVVNGTYAVVAYMCGKSLRECRRRTFLYVVAIFLCLSPPLGTLLGVFTIIALNRETSKELFARNENA